jgi:hypothetical protein
MLSRVVNLAFCKIHKCCDEMKVKLNVLLKFSSAKLYHPLQRQNIIFDNIDDNQLVSCALFTLMFSILKMYVLLSFFLIKFISPGDSLCKQRANFHMNGKIYFFPKTKGLILLSASPGFYKNSLVKCCHLSKKTKTALIS